jgi:hypothetical protein
MIKPTLNAATKSISLVMPSLPVWPVLTAVLIVLKLTGSISIGWLWVLAPLWVPAALGCALLTGILGVLGVALLLSLWLKSKSNHRRDSR